MKWNEVYSKKEILIYGCLILFFALDGLTGRWMPKFLEHIAFCFLFPLGFMVLISTFTRLCFKGNSYLFGSVFLTLSIYLNLKELITGKNISQVYQIIGNAIGALAFASVQKRKLILIKK